VARLGDEGTALVLEKLAGRFDPDQLAEIGAYLDDKDLAKREEAFSLLETIYCRGVSLPAERTPASAQN
jgi:hypothetical protein